MDNAIARRNVVLGLMADTGKISKTQADNAKRTTLTLEDTFSQASTSSMKARSS